MDNSTKKIQAQHNLFNKVLDFYNFSRTRQDLAVIDALTFRKDIMDILDKVEDDECLLKSMEALIEYIRDADKISEEVDDLAVALFNSLNMKDIPQTYNYLHDIFKAELSIFCKSKTIFHICFYYITGMSNTNKSVAENFSFIEHTDFLEKIVKHGFEKDDLISQSKIFLSKIDFSFFSEPHIFTIFEDNRYRSLFNSYIKTYNFLKREKTLSDVNQDIHEEFVANFIEYYIYYDVSFFDHSRQGHIINDIPAEQAADILNNIDLFRYINLDDKGGVEASNDISSLTGIEKYLDSKTFKAISERASRFSDILSFLKDKPAISDYDFGEPEPEIDFNDDTDIPSFLPENDTKTVFFKEKGSDHVKEISYVDFLLKKQEQKKNTEMKIAPDTEGVALNHNTSSFTIYDASAEAELDQYIEDLGDESKGVVALYKKIKRLGNSRSLYNNDLLFKNIDSLRESFPNFSSFIDHIEGHAILNKRGDNHFSIPPSLLVGDPGIGKTFFLAEMAELFGIKREIIHMETISASWLLTGASAQWKDAKTGLIFNKTINSTHANNIVILDELDKALNTSSYPPANSLLQLFEQHTAKEFKDEYFPLRIDVSKMIWLATANDLSTISEPLLSRLDTFRIINPNFDERKQLANRIYSSILKSNAWGSSFDNDLADTVLDKLCQPSDSIREMKKTLMNAIKNCAKRDDATIILEDVSFDTNQSKTKIGFR